MKINIFDVSHGFCALITCDNGARIMIDCGHKENAFYPSSYLRAINCTHLDYLVTQNFDQDHVSDFIGVWNQAPPAVWFINESLTGTQLQALKTVKGPVTTAMGNVISKLNVSPPAQVHPDLGSVALQMRWNRYPVFTDENNLSVVTFLSFGQFRIAFTGDVEKEGWETLLQDQVVRQLLPGVTIFVASHHGRENGYCKEVFDLCVPDLVVISDKEILHSTQLTNYSNVVPNGLNFGNRNRKTITTRNDGNIVIDVAENGIYEVRLATFV